MQLAAQLRCDSANKTLGTRLRIISDYVSREDTEHHVVVSYFLSHGLVGECWLENRLQLNEIC